MKVLIKKQNASQNIKPIYYGQHIVLSTVFVFLFFITTHNI